MWLLLQSQEGTVENEDCGDEATWTMFIPKMVVCDL